MYRRKRPLSKAAYAIAKTLDRDARDARFKDNVTTMAGAAGGAPATIFEAMAKRRDFITQMGGFGAYGKRRKRRYGGRGGYIGRGGFFKKADKFLKGNVGRTLTRAALPYADAYTGGMASQVASAAGYGAYYNGLFPNDSTAVVPSFDGGAQDETGGILFSNKEYLGSITATNLFDNTSWELNPGLAATFPFLAQIAANYQEYAFVQLAFVYKTQLSEVTSTGAIGSIIMCHNQNPNESAFRTKNVMLQKIGSISEVPTRDIVCGIECDPNKIANMTNGGKYTRVGEVPAGTTKDQYDWGTFQLATDGMPVGNEGEVQGELWVSYTVFLRQPILFASTGKAILADAFLINNYTTAGTNDLGYKSPNNNIGCTVKGGKETVSGNLEAYLKITFPPEMLYKVFEVTISMKGARYSVGPEPATGPYNGWPSQTTTALTVLPRGPEFSQFNCTRQFQVEASKYAGEVSTYQYANEGQQRANFIVVPGQVTSGPNKTQWSNSAAAFQDDNCGLFTCIVALDGVFGTESYVKINFPINTAVGACSNLQFDQIMIHVSQVNPALIDVASNNYTQYYADWIQVYTGLN
jgi:hypothetical protein